MELTDLKLLRTIVELGSISRAADQLGYVQSNITARVQKLEAELGTALFLRHSKGVTATEKGRLLSQYAADILQMAEEAILAVKEPDYPSGELRIGVVETVTATDVFIQALSNFQNGYPNVTVSLITGTSFQNYERVANRQLDGAFITGEWDSSKLEVEMKMEERIVLFTPNQGQEGLEFQQAPDTTWIVFPKGCPFRASIEEWTRESGKENANIIEVSTTETMINCVKAGLGYALLPDSVMRDEEKLQVHSIPEKYRFATTRLVRRSERFRNKALSAFSECIKETRVN